MSKQRFLGGLTGANPVDAGGSLLGTGILSLDEAGPSTLSINTGSGYDYANPANATLHDVTSSNSWENGHYMTADGTVVWGGINNKFEKRVLSTPYDITTAGFRTLYNTPNTNFDASNVGFSSEGEYAVFVDSYNSGSSITLRVAKAGAVDDFSTNTYYTGHSLGTGTTIDFSTDRIWGAHFEKALDRVWLITGAFSSAQKIRQYDYTPASGFTNEVIRNLPSAGGTLEWTGLAWGGDHLLTTKNGTWSQASNNVPVAKIDIVNGSIAGQTGSTVSAYSSSLWSGVTPATSQPASIFYGAGGAKLYVGRSNTEIHQFDTGTLGVTETRDLPQARWGGLQGADAVSSPGLRNTGVLSLNELYQSSVSSEDILDNTILDRAGDTLVDRDGDYIKTRV